LRAIVEDGSLVVYTGGFPSAGVVDILSNVLRALPTDVPFLHWGDIDAGGLRIFRYLEENLIIRAGYPPSHGVNSAVDVAPQAD
jgi:hypothetical protein